MTGISKVFKRLAAVTVTVMAMPWSGFSEEQPCCSTSAWKNKNTVGLRLSYTTSSFHGEHYQSSEINWHIPVSASNRLELGVSYAAYWDDDLTPTVAGSYDGTVVEYGGVGSYQWVYNVCRGFSWFIGPSIGAGKWRWPWYTGWRDYDENTEEPVVPNKQMNELWYFGLGAQIGIEYRFSYPMVISMDFRPMWVLEWGRLGGYPFGGDLFGWGWGYRVGYVF